MKIYVIRHGETEWNQEKRFQGRKNSPLTAKGIEQAINLGKKLENIKFDSFYSSTMGRAIDTANYIIKENIASKNLKLNMLSEFAEISLGNMEGVHREEFIEKYPQEFENFFNNPQKYNPSIFNGENYFELEERVKKGLNILFKNHCNNDVIGLVSHGVTIRTIIKLAKKIPSEKLGEIEIPKNTSVYIIEYDSINIDLKEYL